MISRFRNLYVAHSVLSLKFRPSSMPSVLHGSRSFRSSPTRFGNGLTNILEDMDAPPPPVQVKRMTQEGIELVDGELQDAKTPHC